MPTPSVSHEICGLVNARKCGPGIIEAEYLGRLSPSLGQPLSAPLAQTDTDRKSVV